MNLLGRMNNSSSMDVTRHILRKEGVTGLFRGLTATLARECPGNACFFGGYEFTRSVLMMENEKKADIGKRAVTNVSLVHAHLARIGFLKTWLAGGMAGVCFWVVTFPVDVIKSRIQVFKPTVNLVRYTLDIIRNEGEHDRAQRMLNELCSRRIHGAVRGLVSDVGADVHRHGHAVHHLRANASLSATSVLI